MKLLSKTTIAYFVASLAAFGIAAAALLYLFADHVAEEQREQLLKEKAVVMALFDRLGPAGLKDLEQLEWHPASPQAPSEVQFAEAWVWEEDEDERKQVKATTLDWVQSFEGKPYQIRLFAEQLEMEESLEFLLLASLPFVLLLAAFTTIGMRIYSAKAWRPFHQNLKALQNFSPSQSQAIDLESSNTTEFQQLRAMLLQTTEKIRADYQNLKKFTENASHELQTPVAVAQSHLEAAMQAEQFGPEQLAKLEAALHALKRVQKINAQLLLLSKIENAQFPQKERIDLAALVQNQVEEVQELAQAKGRELQCNLSHPFFHQIHPTLAEILTGNLLRNCLNHAQGPGEILLSQTADALLFSNPGLSALPQDQVFQRFFKADSQRAGTGLGLAIVAEICKQEGLQVQYFFKDSRHFFQLGPKIQN